MPIYNQDYIEQDYRNPKQSNNMFNTSMQYNPTIPSYTPQQPQQPQQPLQQPPPQQQPLQYQPLQPQYNTVLKSDQNMNQYNMNSMQRQPFIPQYNELFSNNSNNEHKFNWIKLGKSVVIYTILFLIMSHLKMNDFLCSFIPLLNNNEVLCMVIKGIVMSIVIIVIQNILN